MGIDWGGILGGVGSIAQAGLAAYNTFSSANSSRDAYDNASELSKAQAGIAKEQWNLYKKHHLPNEILQAKETAKDIALYRPLKEQGVADALWAHKQTQPIREQMYKEAREGVDIQAMMDRAGSDTTQRFSSMRKQTSRDMARMGMNPNSGQFGAMQRDLNIAEALGQAGAKTAAYERGQDLNRLLRNNALNFYKGMPLETPQQTNGNAMLASSQEASKMALNSSLQAGGAHLQHTIDSSKMFNDSVKNMKGIDWGSLLGG